MFSEENVPQQLLDEYNKTVPEKIRCLEKLIMTLHSEMSLSNLEALQFLVHKMAGSAGLYGYGEVTVICKIWDVKLLKQIKGLSKEVSVNLSELDGLLTKVKEGFHLSRGC
jgi:hypothetical protein